MSENIFKKFSSAHLKRASLIKEQIEKLEKDLTTLLHIPQSLTIGSMVKRKKVMSAAARAKLSAASKAYWARIRAGKK